MSLSQSNVGQRTIKKSLTFQDPCTCNSASGTQNAAIPESLEVGSVSAGVVTATSATIGGIDISDNTISSTSGLIISSTTTFSSQVIASTITSQTGNLSLVPSTNSTISIPNFTSAVNNVATMVTPILLKTFRIYTTINNMVLSADPTCDGIEIIIYNRNLVLPINVNDAMTLNLITTIPAQTAQSMVFINFIPKWVIF
jgi:hypothetical protein